MNAVLPAGPIIITALLGPADFAWADALRRTHYPPESNRVPAHISLFRHLPPARLPELQRVLSAMTRMYRPPPARLSGVTMLGEGVAYGVDSPDLLAYWERIAEWFHDDLTPQDRAPPRLHITVQNKVAPRLARALHAMLNAEFRPRPLTIMGLAAWHYQGGSWQLARRYGFTGKAA